MRTTVDLCLYRGPAKDDDNDDPLPSPRPAEVSAVYTEEAVTRTATWHERLDTNRKEKRTGSHYSATQ